MKSPALLLLALSLSSTASAAPKWLKATGKVAGHALIGATVSYGVNKAAGGQQWPGVVAVAPVAFFKEYTDWHDHKDTWQKAVLHGLEIEAGAGLEAAFVPKENNAQTDKYRYCGVRAERVLRGGPGHDVCTDHAWLHYNTVR